MGEADRKARAEDAARRRADEAGQAQAAHDRAHAYRSDRLAAVSKIPMALSVLKSAGYPNITTTIAVKGAFGVKRSRAAWMLGYSTHRGWNDEGGGTTVYLLSDGRIFSNDSPINHRGDDHWNGWKDANLGLDRIIQEYK